jgi:hypothetical protein
VVPLQHPSPTSLATDASDTHISNVMQQKSGNHWRALGFFSRKLTDTESCYSTFDSVSIPISPRQQHQLAFISKFNIQMLYLPGLKNVVADFLSRPSPPEPTGNVTAAAAADPVDFEAIAAEQNSCAETQRLLSGTSLKLAFR